MVQEVQKMERNLPVIDRKDADHIPPAAPGNIHRHSTCKGVYADFQLITNQNLPNIFYAEIDCHTPQLITLYRQRVSKTGRTADALVDILRCHDLQVEDSDNPELGDSPVALLTIVVDNTENPVHYNPVKISVVLESEVMVIDLPRLPDAFLISTVTAPLNDHHHQPNMELHSFNNL
ncbi:unnamed protein product [Coregonus sp. 'balchen']|nr:unnamed protein product [Coregonus sp. 'balchen']